MILLQQISFLDDLLAKQDKRQSAPTVQSTLEVNTPAMVSEVTAVPTLALTPLGIERLLIQVEVEPESNKHKSGACNGVPWRPPTRQVENGMRSTLGFS